nr:hypothetical protein [Tanacetum cinerariifolium]
ETDFTRIYDFLKMNQEEDRQIQNVGGNGGNQFGQYAGQVALNQQGFNAWQNGGIQGAQNADVHSGGNQNGLVVVPGIANQSGTSNVVAARAEEQYTDLLEPIPEPQRVPQNDNHVTSVAPSMVQSGGTVETSFAPNEETHAHQETVYRDLVDQVAQVNMVNCNMRATHAEINLRLLDTKFKSNVLKSVRINMTSLK